MINLHRNHQSELMVETVELIRPIFNQPDFPDVLLKGGGRTGRGVCSLNKEKKRFDIYFGSERDPLNTPALILHEFGHTVDHLYYALFGNLYHILFGEGGKPSHNSDQRFADLFACYILEPERLMAQTNRKYHEIYAIFKKFLGKEFSKKDLGCVIESALKARKETERVIARIIINQRAGQEVEVTLLEEEIERIIESTLCKGEEGIFMANKVKYSLPWKDPDYKPEPIYMRALDT
jgi:hypothetical protein